MIDTPHPTAADDARGGETAWLVERTDGHMPGPYAHFFGRQVFWLPNIFTATRFATREEAEATDEVRLSGGVVKAVEHIFDLTLPDALGSPGATPSHGYGAAPAAECTQSQPKETAHD